MISAAERRVRTTGSEGHDNGPVGVGDVIDCVRSVYTHPLLCPQPRPYRRNTAQTSNLQNPRDLRLWSSKRCAVDVRFGMCLVSWQGIEARGSTSRLPQDRCYLRSSNESDVGDSGRWWRLAHRMRSAVWLLFGPLPAASPDSFRHRPTFHSNHHNRRH
jgi:hypothetical protein